MKIKFSNSVVYKIVSVFAALVMLLATAPASQSLKALSDIEATQVNAASSLLSSSVISPPGHTHESTALNSPVMFIENVGQFDEGARFQVRGGDRTIWLADDAVWITLLEQRPAIDDQQPARDDPRSSRGAVIRRSSVKGVNIQLSFVEANPHLRIEPFNRLNTRISYFIGDDPTRWRADAPAWGGVRYKDLYPGIDLEITGEDGRLAQRLVARASADLNQVRLRVEGADAMRLDGDRLRLSTAVGEYTLPLLSVVGASGASLGNPTLAGHQVALPFAASIPNAPSTINNQQTATSAPSDLLYSTFLGGEGGDIGWAVAVDTNGAAYVTGQTNSSTFPTTPGVFDPGCGTDGNCNGYWYYHDVFVAKLSADGSELEYSTYLGGENHDTGQSIAVDANGAAYVTGRTLSGNFPTTPGAFRTPHPSPGGWAAFVTKLDASGSALSYSTFIHDGSQGLGVAVDTNGAAYVTGQTLSPTFPTTPGAFDRSHNGLWDAFVTKLNASGSGLEYSTYLGGSGQDCEANGDYRECAIAVDANGAAYVTGMTASANFPTTSDALYRSNRGGFDFFVTKLNPGGSGLEYSTYLGGSADEYCYACAVAVDTSGAAYVTGQTASSDFPTANAFDASYNGGAWDGFAAKLNPPGSALAYSTYLGGGGEEGGHSIAVDGTDSAYVTGYTFSSDFPATSGAFDTTHNGGRDAFVARLDAGGAGLAYATFLGGGGHDRGYGIAVDGADGAYIAGETYSSDFPVTPGAFDTSFNGSGDAFVAKLHVGSANVSLRVLDENGAPLPWHRLVTQTLRLEAEVLQGMYPDVMTATVESSNSQLTTSVLLERVETSNKYRGAVPLNQIVNRAATNTAAAALYVRDDYTQEQIEFEYELAAAFLADLGPESRWRGIAQGNGDEERFIPPANLEFMQAAGYEVVTVTLQSPQTAATRAFVHNQAEILLYVGHGHHDDNYLDLNGERSAKPDDFINGVWTEGLNKVILMGCSVLDINDYNSWWPGGSHLASPGKKWATIPGPEQLMGFQYMAPLVGDPDDKGERAIELWSLYYTEVSPWWCLNESAGICAWRLATSVNINPLTRFPTATAIDTDKYYYWKKWFQIPHLNIDVFTWQSVPRDEWELDRDDLGALMGSPVELHFYDRDGHHLGPNSSGGFDTDIPGSSYQIPEGTDYKVAFIRNADLSDEYIVRLVGTGAGTFDFNLLIPERNVGVRYDVAYVDIPVVTGTLGTIDLRSGTSFTLSLDMDGDGWFEQQLTPTAMTTHMLVPPYTLYDGFNRPDSTTLGPQWVETSGDWDIVAGQLHLRTDGHQREVAASRVFTETRFTIESRITGLGYGTKPPDHYELFFGADARGRGGYGVMYEPQRQRLSLMKHQRQLASVSIYLATESWYNLRLVRDGGTGSIQIYLDQGEGYGTEPVLEANDTTYPTLGRLGWRARSKGFDFYVDWITVR